MHQAIIHWAEQLFTSPSKASMMGHHFGGVLGGCVCVYTRGWAGFPTSSPPRILLFNSQGLQVSGVKGETLIMNLTCIGMTQKKLVVLLS